MNITLGFLEEEQDKYATITGSELLGAIAETSAINQNKYLLLNKAAGMWWEGLSAHVNGIWEGC